MTSQIINFRHTSKARSTKSAYDVILLSNMPRLYQPRERSSWLSEGVTIRYITHTANDLLRILDRWDSAIKKRRPSDVFVLLIDLEALGGFSKGFPYLRRIRETYPSLVTVVLADEAKNHDTSIHRLPICDAMLGIPFSKEDLDVALYAAAKNNLFWQDRVKALNSERPEMRPNLEEPE